MWKWLRDNIYFKSDVKKGLRKISGAVSSVHALLKDTAGTLSDVSDSVTDTAQKVMEVSRKMTAVSEKFDTVRSLNDRLFQDIAEEIDDLRKDQREGIEDLKKSLTGKAPSKTSSESGSDLLRLIRIYRRELIALEGMLEKDEAWKQQVILLQEKMRQEEASAGIYAFGKEGEKINLDMHQITDITACEDPSSDRTIARVYEEGFIIRGRIVQKAVVSAYKYGGNTDESGNDYRN